MAAPVAAWDGRGVTIPEVVSHLARLRQPEAEAAPLSLTGVLNLVAVAPEPAEVDEMREVVTSMATSQPSRAVLLSLEEGAGAIDAEVATSCWLVGAHHGAVCAELVVLRLRGDAREGAASAVVPLLRSELPTFLWWPMAPRRDDPLLKGLGMLAQRLITEAGGTDAIEAGRCLADLAAAAGPAPTDLAWAALTPWRQLLAQLLTAEDVERLQAGPTVAALGHPGAEPTLEVLLMGGWLRDLLGSGVMIEHHRRQDDRSGLVAIELERGGGGRLAIERIPGRPTAAVLLTQPGQRARRRVLPLPVASRAELLAGELQLQRPDRGFERAVALAAEGAT